MSLQPANCACRCTRKGCIYALLRLLSIILCLGEGLRRSISSNKVRDEQLKRVQDEDNVNMALSETLFI